MTIAKVKQRPLRLGSNQKRDVRTQFGALCWRMQKDKLQVAIITSRRTRRWVLPKGWPMDGATPSEAAQREAFEEAGIRGKVTDICLGIYSYTKALEEEDDLPVVVAIFPLKAKESLKTWPESKERRRRWLSPKKAAALVDIPELKQVIAQFDPARLPK